MDAISVEIAEAVKTRIAGATLSKSGFTLERSYADWDLELDKMDIPSEADAGKLRVDVAIHTTEQETQLATRGSISFLLPIDIAVRERFRQERQDEATGRVPLAKVDELMLLTQELVQLFARQRLADFEPATHEDTRIVVAPWKEHLRKNKQFTSIVRVVFRANLALPEFSS